MDAKADHRPINSHTLLQIKMPGYVPGIFLFNRPEPALYRLGKPFRFSGYLFSSLFPGKIVISHLRELPSG